MSRIDSSSFSSYHVLIFSQKPGKSLRHFTFMSSSPMHLDRLLCGPSSGDGEGGGESAQGEEVGDTVHRTEGSSSYEFASAGVETC